MTHEEAEQYVVVCLHPEGGAKVYGAWDKEREAEDWLDEDHLSEGYGESEYACNNGVDAADHFIADVIGAA